MEVNRLYHNSRDAEKKEKVKLKKDLLVLIVQELQSEGFYEVAESLIEQAFCGLEELEPCDNMDLSMILSDFISYYKIRFDKRPQLTKKSTKPMPSNDSKSKQQCRRSSKEVSSCAKDDTAEKNLNQIFDSEFTLPKHLLRFEETRDIAIKISNERVAPSKSPLTWIDVVGHEEAKNLLMETIAFPILEPKAFARIPKSSGVLLYGPPGTGKTLLVNTLASLLEEKVHFLNFKISSFASKWRGDSEKFIRIAFEIARANSPCIIFIDEVDALLGDRGSGLEHEASRRFKAEFLIQMDGIQSSRDAGSHVYVVASTNQPWSLDPATLRRFSDHCYVGLPSVEDHSDLIAKFLPPKAHRESLPGKYTSLVEGLSGSDIRESVLSARRKMVVLELQSNSMSSNLEDEITNALKKRKKFRGIEKKFYDWMNKRTLG